MTARPFMQRKIADLEVLFSASQTDQNTLRLLEYELGFRQVPRAVALLKAVRAVLSGSAPAIPPAPKTISLQKPILPRQSGLWESPALAVPPVSSGTPTPVEKTKNSCDAPGTMTLDEAYRILHSTSGSTWESIEQNRRELVQKAHPDILLHMTPEKRAAVQAEARRVNEAYRLIRDERIE